MLTGIRGFRNSVFLFLLKSALRTGGDVTMRQFRRNPGYCGCDNSAVILPVGQVLISGQLHAQVICCNCGAEADTWILCCSLGSGVTQPKSCNQLQLQGLGHVIPTFIFLLSAFCSSRGAPMELHSCLFSACLGFCWKQAVLRQPGDEYK